jgi:hypothetical protein
MQPFEPFHFLEWLDPDHSGRITGDRDKGYTFVSEKQREVWIREKHDLQGRQNVMSMPPALVAA